MDRVLTPGSYRHGVESGLSRAAAALSALFALSWSGFLLSGGVEPAPDVRAVAVVFLAQAVVTGVRGARLTLSRVDSGVAVGLAVLGQVVLAAGGASRVVVGQRCLLTVPAVLLAAALLPRRARRWSCVVAMGAQITTSWPADGPAGAVEGVWPVVATAVAGDVLAPLMRTAGDRADRAQRRVRAVRAAAGREEGRREAHRNFQGTLHDEVSTALQAISLPGIPVSRLREAASGAVAALDAAPAGPGREGRADLSTVVRALRPPSGTALTVEAAGALHVPSRVADAVAGAAREALRNVEEHAAARTVHVRLQGDGSGRPGAKRDEGFHLSVTDDGAGFAAGELAPSSVGLRRSVIRRMEEVGGRAEVRSAPGRGTTVRLEWHPPVVRPEGATEGAGLRDGGSEGTIGRMRAAVGDVRRPLAAVCLPFLVTMGVVAVVHTSRGPDTGPLLVWYGLLAALTVALLLRANTRIPGPVAGAACVFAVAGALGSFFVLPLSAIKDFESWPIGAVTPLLTLLVIVRPAWEALTALALEQVGIVVLVMTGPPIAPSPGATVAVVLPALFAPALGVLAGLAIGRTVARLGGVTARAEAARSATLATEAARRAREELHRERLNHLGEEILPFLAEVGSGRYGPDDPGVRDRARLLAGAVRDEIQLPGVLDRTVRGLLAAARGAECAVVIQSDSDEPHPPSFLRLLLTTALTSGPTPREVFLTVNAATGTVRASLVILPGDEQRARALSDAVSVAGAGAQAEVANSDTSTWVEAAVRAP
ncbi:sensor histidine kinase [Streptomyces sp. AC512_CC834]|uniref:sensor histidine kinase n=1 Tax=Streptomyces sp. AC512_CC834 TaxID=2823691 RepID=UPI001C25DA6B|nr:ATP-binding protein [Streptomyces sp. AC512_CC834]